MIEYRIQNTVLRSVKSLFLMLTGLELSGKLSIREKGCAHWIPAFAGMTRNNRIDGK